MMKKCNRPWCGCKTQHSLIWTSTPGFIGTVYGLTCGNCGDVKIGRNMLVNDPDGEASRWATDDELRAMRKAQKAVTA